MYRLLFALVMLVPGILPGQVAEYDFFPQNLMKERDIKAVAVYETEIADPPTYAGPQNNVKLSRKLLKESYYDENGLLTRTIIFKPGSEAVQHLLEYRYSPEQRLTETRYSYPTGGPGSATQFQRSSHYGYSPSGKLTSEVIRLNDQGSGQVSDSIVYEYDAMHRLAAKHTYKANNGSFELVVSDVFDYMACSMTLTKYTANGEEVERLEGDYDLEGRLVDFRHFVAGKQNPIYSAYYNYDPRGWLQYIEYQRDWKHFGSKDHVIWKKYAYDHHGKLTEIHEDYANRKRVDRYYDYSYYLN